MPGSARRPRLIDPFLDKVEEWVDHSQAHCCIGAKRVLSMDQAGKQDPSCALENPNKPDIWRPTARLLDEWLEQVGWTDRSMQQCRPYTSFGSQRLTAHRDLVSHMRTFLTRV